MTASIRTAIPAVALAIGVTLSAGVAQATNIFADRSDCIDTNCASTFLNGTLGGGAGGTLPWTVQAYARPSECFVVDVTVQQADLVARVVAPDGSTTWFNDDSGGTLRPRLEILTPAGSTPGWYTIVLSVFGGQPTFANFTLAVGRYLSSTPGVDNPNCQNPTPPGSASAFRSRSSGSDKSALDDSQDEYSEPGDPGAE